VAYSEELADRIREIIGFREGVTERKMFGGIAWMIHGNMAVGIAKEEFIVRVEADEREELLTQPGVGEMAFNGPPLKGFVKVAETHIEDEEELTRWIDCGADFAASMPEK